MCFIGATLCFTYADDDDVFLKGVLGSCRQRLMRDTLSDRVELNVILTA